jgi:hypothetical protein
MPIIGGRSASVRGLGFQGAGKPSAPVSVSATNVGTSRAFNNGAATVSFTAGSSNGAPITSFTVTSSPGGYTATGASSPLTVAGLQSNTAYTFTVTATNGVGVGQWNISEKKFKEEFDRRKLRQSYHSYVLRKLNTQVSRNDRTQTSNFLDQYEDFYLF